MPSTSHSSRFQGIAALRHPKRSYRPTAAHASNSDQALVHEAVEIMNANGFSKIPFDGLRLAQGHYLSGGPIGYLRMFHLGTGWVADISSSFIVLHRYPDATHGKNSTRLFRSTFVETKGKALHELDGLQLKK